MYSQKTLELVKPYVENKQFYTSLIVYPKHGPRKVAPDITSWKSKKNMKSKEPLKLWAHISHKKCR